MSNDWTTVCGVKVLREQSKIGVKIGRTSGRWHELDPEAARKLAELLTDAVKQLGRANWKPNDLGGYKPKPGKEPEQREPAISG